MSLQLAEQNPDLSAKSEKWPSERAASPGSQDVRAMRSLPLESASLSDGNYTQAENSVQGP